MIKRQSLLLLQGLILLLSSSFSRRANAQELLWSDEFNSNDDDVVNVNHWSYDTGGGGWGNGELQTYSRNNVRVENGNLVIRVDDSGIITSGRIRSQGKLEFLYGRIEARIQIPNPARGLWPSLWMLGADFAKVGWPKSGSMTMMQMGSADALQSGQATSRVGAALHYEEENGQPASFSNSVDTQMDLTADFHIYSMDWTPNEINMFVDGNKYMSTDISDSACPACDEQFHNKPYFMILSVAVGGGFSNIYNQAGITAPLPADMLVDYIRIYDNGFTQLSGSAAIATTTGTPTVSPTKPPTTAPVPTVSPTVDVTPEPTLPPTVAATPEITPAPTTPPPTAPTTTSDPTTSPSTRPPSGLPVSKDPPTMAPTGEDDSSTQSDLPIQTAQAAGIFMALTDIKPLDKKAQLIWAEITEWHLQNEIYNSIGAERVEVNVTYVSQNPPYIETRRALRSVDSRQLEEAAQQVIVFNADYAIQSDAQVTDVNRFVEGAFDSNYKRAIYLDELKGYAAFENVTYVSVEPATKVSNDAKGANTNNPGGSATDIGLIVGMVCAALVVLILGMALYARRRKQRPSTRSASVSSMTPSSRAKESALERSGTIDEESLYTSHPKHKVAPNSINGSLYTRESESEYSGMSSSLSNLDSVDYNYRDAFKNISKSVASGLTPGSGNSTSKEDLTVVDEFTVEAPKGRLGLILETSYEGCPTVQEVKTSSPLNGSVQVGDRLHSVDGRDVTMVMAETVSRVIASKENCETRTFVFARPQK